MVSQPRYRSHLPHWQMGDGPSERVLFAAKVDPQNYKQEAIQAWPDLARCPAHLSGAVSHFLTDLAGSGGLTALQRIKSQGGDLKKI